jgi:hypothetical protein
MISETLIQRGEIFRATWNQILEKSPKYILDLTWPSFTVIDLILKNLRGKPSLTEDESVLLESALASTIPFLISCFESFPPLHEGGTVEVTISDEGVLEVKGALGLPSRSRYTISLLEIIKQIYAQTNVQLEICKEEKQISLSEPLFPALILSILSGSAPFSESPYKELSLREMVPIFVAIEITMGNSTTQHLHRVFPSLQFPTEIDLSRMNVLFPPAGFREVSIGERAILEFHSSITKAHLSTLEIESLSYIFARCAEKSLQRMGVIISMALAPSDLSLDLQLSTLSLGKELFRSLPTLQVTRKILDLPLSWSESLGNREVVENQYRTEVGLQILPCACIAAEHLDLEEAYPGFLLLAFGQWEAYSAWSIGYLEENFSLPAEFYLQGGYFDVLFSQTEQLEKRLLLIQQNIQSPTVYEQVLFTELQAMHAVQTGNAPLAIQKFSDIIKADLPMSCSFLPKIYPLLLLEAGSFDELLKMDPEEYRPSIELRCARIIAWIEKGDIFEAEKELQILIQNCAYHPMVFDCYLRMREFS